MALPTTGLVLHLESDSGVTESGGTVSSWADQTIQGNDLAAGGAPQFVTATDLDNNSVIDFDGVDDKLEKLTGVSGLSSGNDDRSMFYVANYRGLGYGGLAYGNNSGNQSFGLIVTNTGFLANEGWGSANDFASSTVGTGEGWMIHGSVLDAGTINHYKDNIEIDSNSHTYATLVNKIRLGVQLNSVHYMDMQVAAVLIYDRAVSETERLDIDNYLRNKYFPGAATRTLTFTGLIANESEIRVRDGVYTLPNGHVNPVTSSAYIMTFPERATADKVTYSVTTPGYETVNRSVNLHNLDIVIDLELIPDQSYVA